MAPALSNTDADYDVVVIGSGRRLSRLLCIIDGGRPRSLLRDMDVRAKTGGSHGADAEMSTGRPARDFGVPKVILSPLRIEDFDLH
jgi:hypothetical protein